MRFSIAPWVFLFKNKDLGGSSKNKFCPMPINAKINVTINIPIGRYDQLPGCFKLYMKKQSGKILSQTNIYRLIEGAGLQLIDKPIQI